MTETHYIVNILILLSAAVVAVPLFQRLGLGAVLGFLVAGALVGPWGLGFIVAVDERYDTSRNLVSSSYCLSSASS